AEQGVIQDWIADSRIEIEQVRLLVLKTAWLMDTVGAKGAATEISAIKVAAPAVALRVRARAIQAHGAAGVSQDFPLASMYAHLRTLRLADGPDEVHRMQVARREIRKYAPAYASGISTVPCASAAGLSPPGSTLVTSTCTTAVRLVMATIVASARSVP